MLRPVPAESPSANPVRSVRLPGSSPRFETLPYEKPPFSPRPLCAVVEAAAASAAATRQVSVRVLGTSVPGATPWCPRLCLCAAEACRLKRRRLMTHTRHPRALDTRLSSAQSERRVEAKTGLPGHG